MKRFNKRLLETSKERKAGLVFIVLDGRFLDPPQDTTEVEVSVMVEDFDKLWPMVIDILRDHKKLAST